MKTKIIILSGLMFLSQVNLFGQNWNKISKEIRTKQREFFQFTCVNGHYTLRQKTNWFKQMHIEKNDTVFLLEESNDYSDPIISFTVWNRRDTLNYSSDKCYFNSHDCGKNYTKEKQPNFTKYMMKLVSEWNLEEIKIEDKKNGGSLPQYWVASTRIIFHDKKYTIDCIYFRSFFNIKRDRMDFIE